MRATLTPLSKTDSKEPRLRLIGSPVRAKNAWFIPAEESVKFRGTPRSSWTHLWLKNAFWNRVGSVVRFETVTSKGLRCIITVNTWVSSC